MVRLYNFLSRMGQWNKQRLIKSSGGKSLCLSFLLVAVCSQPSASAAGWRVGQANPGEGVALGLVLRCCA
eukprot:3739442-Amphidinium_carterae.1